MRAHQRAGQRAPPEWRARAASESAHTAHSAELRPRPRRHASCIHDAHQSGEYTPPTSQTDMSEAHIRVCLHRHRSLAAATYIWLQRLEYETHTSLHRHRCSTVQLSYHSDRTDASSRKSQPSASHVNFSRDAKGHPCAQRQTPPTCPRRNLPRTCMHDQESRMLADDRFELIKCARFSPRLPGASNRRQAFEASPAPSPHHDLQACGPTSGMGATAAMKN